jgi:hypothetical protein
MCSTRVSEHILNCLLSSHFIGMRKLRVHRLTIRYLLGVSEIKILSSTTALLTHMVPRRLSIARQKPIRPSQQYLFLYFAKPLTMTTAATKLPRTDLQGRSPSLEPGNREVPSPRNHQDLQINDVRLEIRLGQGLRMASMPRRSSRPSSPHLSHDDEKDLTQTISLGSVQGV